MNKVLGELVPPNISIYPRKLSQPIFGAKNKPLTNVRLSDYVHKRAV